MYLQKSSIGKISSALSRDVLINFSERLTPASEYHLRSFYMGGGFFAFSFPWKPGKFSGFQALQKYFGEN